MPVIDTIPCIDRYVLGLRMFSPDQAVRLDISANWKDTVFLFVLWKFCMYCRGEFF